jgi:hypothetical protein
MDKAIAELLPYTPNTLNANMEWINNFSKLNDIALAKLDFTKK